MCRGCREVVKSGWQVVRPWMGSFHNRTRLDVVGCMESPCCYQAMSKLIDKSMVHHVWKGEICV